METVVSEARLVGISGAFEGSVAPIEGDVTIGRGSDNTLILDDPSIAERQCLISKQGRHWILRDVDHHTRTFVNGLPARGVALRHGDRFSVGTTAFLFLAYPHLDVRPCPVQLVDRDLASTMRIRRDNALNFAVESPDGSALLAHRLNLARRLRRDLNAVFKVSAAVNSVRDLAAFKRCLLELILEALPAQRGAILLAQAGTAQFESVIGCDRSGGPEDSEPMRVSRGVCETVLRRRIGIGCEDIRSSANPADRAIAVLAAPIAADTPVGVIYLETTDPHVRFDKGHLRLLTALGGIAAMALNNLRQVEQLEVENRRLRAHASLQHHVLLGESPGIAHVQQLIAKVAPTVTSVLVIGESGTGKELVARAIHQNSPRRNRPFVAINCAAIPDALLESELFGYEKGAFTGALLQKVGKLEVANGGIVFLDEVSELPLALQPKLLRVLQEREFERVGATLSTKVDIRIIASTNIDLEAAVAAGRFRSDLYYRLNVVQLTIPPLRARRDDILALARHFAARHGQGGPRRTATIAPESESVLMRYDWPGNVRELENAIEHALVLGSDGVILPDDLPEAVREGRQGLDSAGSGYHAAVKRAKRDLIVEAVKEAGGNCVKAAKLLGLNPTYLHRLIRQFGLTDVK